MCVCVFGFRLLSGFFLAWVLGCVASCVRHVRFLSPSGRPPVAWGCAVLPWVGFVPPLPFGFFLFFAGGVSLRVVLWLCDVSRWLFRSWVLCSPPPLPLSFGLRLRVICFPSLPQRGVCRRVRGVLSFGGPLLLVGCRRFWLGGPPVFLWGVPSSVPSRWGVSPPLVGGRFRGCGPFSCPPPLFFFRGGSACSSLCLPLAGARTDRHSVWLTGLLLALAFC